MAQRHDRLSSPSGLLLSLAAVIAIITLTAACGSGPAPAPTPTPGSTSVPTVGTGGAGEATPTATAQNSVVGNAGTPSPGVTAVDVAPATPPPPPDDAAPTPTPVTATSTGRPLTALEALARLKPQALAWQADARLGMLANTRPGQQKGLLMSTPADPDVGEPTPGGRGRNWTLVAFSPSARAAMAFSMDGSRVDLTKEGAVSDEVLAGFSRPGMQALDLAALDTTRLVDSDEIAERAGAQGSSENTGIALLAPDGLGLGPLPTPPSGGSPPQLAYELFNSGASGTGQQAFIFFDAATGKVILDSSAP